MSVVNGNTLKPLCLSYADAECSHSVVMATLTISTDEYFLFFFVCISCQSSQWKHAEAFVSVIEKYADAEQGVLQRSQSAVMATLTTLLQDHRKQERDKG